MQHEPRLCGIARTQQRREIAIDFDHFEPSGGRQQPLRECALAGPDLHRGVARLEVDRRHDARDHGRIVQEMLAKALARAAVGNAQTGSRRCAICAAISIAAIRLPGSARPLPARSSAVP